MKSEELKQLFLAEALSHHEELNKLFIELEKDLTNSSHINHIFRRLHTLKGDAAGMGFEAIAELTHAMEDIFSEMKKQGWKIEKEDFNHLFRALDKLGELLDAIKTEERVSYKGLKTKLRLLLEKARAEREGATEVAQPERPNQPESKAEENAVGQSMQEEVPQEKEQKAEAAKEVPPVSSQKTKEEKEEEQALREEEEQQEKEEEESAKSKASKIAFSDFIQVPVKKLDDLMNLVGELAIEKDHMATSGTQNRGNLNGFDRLHRITSDLQYSVMGARLVKVELLFNKFHRIVRDVARSEGKEVNLVLEGTEIEIDRNVLQTISDSMIHLVRNAVSHGIEEPEEREQKGKPREGLLKLEAKNLKDTIVIQVTDDGRGIDPERVRQKAIERGLFTPETAKGLSEQEVIELIFEPNFSLKEKVTAVSGRGVGMDVVRNAIDQIGGSVQIRTAANVGSSFSLHLPASMAVKNALLFMLGDSSFAIPLSFTEAVVSVAKSDIHRAASGLITTHQEKIISVVFLEDVFAAKDIEDIHENRRMQHGLERYSDDTILNMIVVASDNRHIGLVVDRLLQQKEIIEKPMVKPMENIYFFSGATILGNGSVCLILDIPNMTKILFRTSGLVTQKTAEVAY